MRKVSLASNDSPSVRSESESSPVAHGTAPNWKSRPIRTDSQDDTKSDSDDAHTTSGLESDESEASATALADLGPLGDGVLRPPGMPPMMPPQTQEPRDKVGADARDASDVGAAPPNLKKMKTEIHVKNEKKTTNTDTKTTQKSPAAAASKTPAPTPNTDQERGEDVIYQNGEGSWCRIAQR